MATAVTSMRIPTELNERYSRLAKETGRSRSFYVNEALQEAIDRFEYEYGILKDIEDYRAGRLETYSIDEVRAHCGLANSFHEERRQGDAQARQGRCRAGV